MPNKKILLFTGLLVILAAGSFFFDKARQSAGKADARLGTSLMTVEDFAKVEKVTLKKGESEVTLTRDANAAWQVKTADDFPAAAEKVVKLFEDLAAVKVARLVSSNTAGQVDYELGEEGVLRLEDAGKPLLEINLGKSDQHGSQFLQFSGEDKVYLSNRRVSVTSEVSAWELRVLLDVKPAEIKSVVYNPRKARKTKGATLFRDKTEGDFNLKGAPADAKLNAGEVSQLGQMLVNFSYSKRHKRDLGEFANLFADAAETIVTTFDGVTYSVLVAKRSGEKKSNAKDKEAEVKNQYFVSIRQEQQSGAGSTSDLINSLMERWVFEIDDYQARRFLKSEKDFLDSGKKGS